MSQAIKKFTSLHRSQCPISSVLDILGDKWSLLIVRDMVYFKKQTFGDFLSSDEGIARNILTDRLTKLEAAGIIFKVDCPYDGRIRSYFLTERGIDLIPLMFEVTEWGVKHIASVAASNEWLAFVAQDKHRAITLTRQAVEKGESVFVGEQSVMNVNVNYLHNCLI